MNRDLNNSLNKLGEIFDKTKVEERQELAGLFGELAYNEVHKLADREQTKLAVQIALEKDDDRKAALKKEKANWEDGGKNKIALHAVVGGIMSSLGNGDFISGASGAAVNELVQKELAKAFKDNPDKHQWASALIGGVVSKIVSNDAQSGASTAASGTKNNFYHYFLKDVIMSIKPEDLKLNEAYAIMFNGSYKIAGLEVGCFIAKDINGRLVVYDNTGIQGQASMSNVPFAASISKVTFRENINASSVIAGAAASASLDVSGAHLDGSVPISSEFLRNVSFSKGVSTELAATIAMSVAYAVRIGYVDETSTWDYSYGFSESYNKVVNHYLTNASAEEKRNTVMYKDKHSNKIIIRKNVNGEIKQLANEGGKIKWVDLTRVPELDSKQYQIIKLG